MEHNTVITHHDNAGGLGGLPRIYNPAVWKATFSVSQTMGVSYQYTIYMSRVSSRVDIFGGESSTLVGKE